MPDAGRRPFLFGPKWAAAGKGGSVKYFVLTNNPLVQERLAPETAVVFEPVGIRAIFEQAALYIAEGHRLLTHPLSGSVKPGETPYKSMLVTRNASSEMDAVSARLVSNALDACGKFANKTEAYDGKALHDLQLVDYSLIHAALCSARA